MHRRTDFWDLLGQVSTLMETALISRRHGIGIRWQQIGSWDLSEKVSSPIFLKKEFIGTVFLRISGCFHQIHLLLIFPWSLYIYSRRRKIKFSPWPRWKKPVFSSFFALQISWSYHDHTMKIDSPIAAADCPMIQWESPLRLKQYDAAMTLLIRARKLWATIEAGMSRQVAQGLIPIFLWNIGGTSIYQLNLGVSPQYQGFDMSSVIQKGVWKGGFWPAMKRWKKKFAKLKPPQRTWTSHGSRKPHGSVNGSVNPSSSPLWSQLFLWGLDECDFCQWMFWNHEKINGYYMLLYGWLYPDTSWH